jgi:DNA-binding PadR family transcriptional regulator
MMLNPIAYALLGLLRVKPLSGYEMKAWIDKSIRFFWAASYGQIYPELRRLEAAGLVERESAPQGQRQRNVYRLTPDGDAVLHEWLVADDVGYEYRDLGLLKLFLSDGLTAQQQLALLERLAANHARTLEQLRELERGLPAGVGYPRTLVLEYGLALHEFNVDWFRRAKQRVKRRAA